MPKIQKSFEIRASKLRNVNLSSVELGGVNDYVNVPSNSAFNIMTGDFTLEAYVKIDSLAVDRMIISRRGTRGFQFYVDTAGRLVLTNIGVANYFSGSSITAGEWFHVCARKIGLAVVFLINGVQDSGQVVSAFADATAPTNLTFGIQNNDLSSRPMDGKIDEIRIWNVGRKVAQIEDNFNKRVSANTPGLVGYWKFDEKSGTTALDSSPTGANGTLTNGASFSSDIEPIYVEEFQARFPVYEFSEFSSTINSGLSDATLVLPRKFDNFGRGGEVDYNNKFEVICYDKENRDGQLIYTGYQLGDVAQASGNGQQVTVNLAGYITKLTRDYVQNNLGQFKFTYTSAEIGVQIENILDDFKAQNPLINIDYTAESIQDSGVSRTFDVSTTQYLDAINAVAKLAGAGWYYYLDADNIFNFKQISTTAKHFFTFKKDIASLKIDRSIANTYNEILFAAGTTGYSASDTASQIEYGRLVQAKQDNRYSNPTSINDFNSQFIEVNKDPFISLTLEIIDSNYNTRGYDIESIQVGDTFSLRNYEGNDDLDGVHVITNLTYKDQSIVIKSQDVTEFLEREIFRLENEQQRINFANGPTTY